jgi:hypothetical protein
MFAILLLIAAGWWMSKDWLVLQDAGAGFTAARFAA